MLTGKARLGYNRWVWTPPERIRHRLTEVRWPTAAEAGAARLFSPLRIGRKLLVEQRTWVPAMVPWRASEEGYVTPQILEWYERFAEGQPGVLVVEATGVRDIPSGPLLRIGHDRFIEGLRRLVETVRRASQGHTRLFIQIIDFLAIKRRPEKSKYFQRYLKLADRHRSGLAELTGEPGWLAAPENELRQRLEQATDAELDRLLSSREVEDLRMGARERVTDVELPHIRELPAVLPPVFADAAERAQTAGFDGVELHYAHAYTVASFLSARNTRADGYGGSRENRIRLPLEVYRAVRERVGGDYVVGVRMLGEEVIEGGSGVDDAVFFAVELARAGLDYLSISKGGKFEDAKQPEVGWAAYPYTGPSGYECIPTVISDRRGPFGRNVPLAAAIKRAVGEAGLATPVVTSGGICHFYQAEAILERGEADLVAAARQTLADPDWFLKMRMGRGGEIRRCEFTNYCEALDQRHKQVTCKLWDRKELNQPGVMLDPTGKRRLTAPRWDPGV
jgi:2,4-dienoyl-CoA reductase-like NADH-dependent reductase (Old Yellow Enzyme family)